MDYFDTITMHRLLRSILIESRIQTRLQLSARNTLCSPKIPEEELEELRDAEKQKIYKEHGV